MNNIPAIYILCSFVKFCNVKCQCAVCSSYIICLVHIVRNEMSMKFNSTPLLYTLTHAVWGRSCDQ